MSRSTDVANALVVSFSAAIVPVAVGGPMWATQASTSVVRVNGLGATSNSRPSEALVLAELSEADIAMLEMAARQGVAYVDYYDPTDDEDDE